MKTATASILIVDDEREILRALQRSLVAHSYRVLTAMDGTNGTVHGALSSGVRAALELRKIL